ncbi:MAG: hypothetical protein ACJ8DI_29765 [Ktedonobacteraceae bacterium]
MSLPSFTAEVSLYHNRHHYRVHAQYARLEADTVVPAQRCPFPCYEANVACITPVLFNTCWCPKDGQHCPEGGWWAAGACFSFPSPVWVHGCHPG